MSHPSPAIALPLTLLPCKPHWNKRNPSAPNEARLSIDPIGCVLQHFSLVSIKGATYGLPPCASNSLTWTKKLYKFQRYQPYGSYLKSIIWLDKYKDEYHDELSAVFHTAKGNRW
jgi:hypothetical protein